MTHQSRDMTFPPDLRHSDGTGPTPHKRPVYQNLLPPCNHACGAGENIQGWLDLLNQGQEQQAWQLLVQDNPMPAVLGRVCYHPCETSCNRAQVDSAVSIHQAERYLGDQALTQGWNIQPMTQPSGKKVLIVGAGPSGLSASYHLALLGHQVEIFEAGPVAGGMMHFGIPAYRLPRDVLAAEVKRIEQLGVQIHLNHPVKDLQQALKQGQFDAAFVAIGAHLSRKIDIPAREASHILDAVQYLREAGTGGQPMLGRRVAVYGGGNTAMDAARTARRLGAEDAMIIYRRDRDHMPAHDFEADEAMEEGVKIHWLRTIRDFKDQQITIEKMELDEQGQPQPTGELETLEADALVLALGQQTDASLLESFNDIEPNDDGTVDVNHKMMTQHPGIFAGGDMVPSQRTVTAAIGHGKKAARNIHGYLTSQENPTQKSPIVPFEALHLWYQTEASSTPQPELDAKQRSHSFTEVLGGLDGEQVRYEASRCFSCGNCFECDGCFGACPEDAIIKLGKGQFYRVDYDRCTGCGACVLQCPTAAIHMTTPDTGAKHD